MTAVALNVQAAHYQGQHYCCQ